MQIFLNSLKNYAKSLKYIFTPVGIIAICFVIGASIAYSNIYSSINNLTLEIQTLLSQSKQVDFIKIATFVAEYINKDITNDFNATLNKLFTQEYLTTMFQNVLSEFYPTLDANLDVVKNLVNACIQSVFMGIYIIMVFILVGVFAGYLLTRFMLVRDIRRRHFWQAIVFTIINALVTVGFVYLLVLVTDLGYWSIPLSILIILINNAVSLFIGWLIQGYKKIELKKVLSFKNIISLFLANLVILVTAFAAIVLVLLTKMILLFILLGISIVDITAVTMSVNAEGYVYYLINNKQKVSK